MNEEAKIIKIDVYTGSPKFRVDIHLISLKFCNNKGKTLLLAVFLFNDKYFNNNVYTCCH